MLWSLFDNPQNGGYASVRQVTTRDHIRRVPKQSPDLRGFFICTRIRLDRSAARIRYAQHMLNAARRGIEFDLTFEEWWEIWEPRWNERGRGTNQLGMCRTRDQGPYAAGNVRLDTPKGNAGDRVLMKRRPWFAEMKAGNSDGGFKSYSSRFSHPELALEIARGERDFEPYQ